MVATPNWSLIRSCHNSLIPISLIPIRLYLYAVGFLYNLSVGFLQTEDGMRQQKTLRDRIEGRIARRQREEVFLPREVAGLGGENQVVRHHLISPPKIGKFTRQEYVF